MWRYVTGSTSAIQKKLPSNTKSPPSDDEYVFVEGEDIDPEYEVVNPALKLHTKPYTSTELSSIIKKVILKEKFIFHEKYSDPQCNIFCYSIFKDQQQKRRMLLFDVVTDRIQEDMPYLDRAFEFYKTNPNPTDLNGDLLIVPVYEVATEHFRLLVITQHAITYYDSKNYLTIQKTHLTSALLYSFMKASGEVIFDRMEEEIPSNYFQRSIVMAKLLGELGGKTLLYCPDHFNPVEKICKKHFPMMEFCEYALGHNDETADSGVYTASYLESCIQGNIPDKKEDPIALRARFSGDEKANNPVTTTVNTKDENDELATTAGLRCAPS